MDTATRRTSSSPYRPLTRALRRGSTVLPAPAGSNVRRPRSKRLLVVLSLSTLVLIVWFTSRGTGSRGAGKRGKSRGVKGARVVSEEHCVRFPWSGGCTGVGLGLGPFDELDYKRSAGHLEYPAVVTKSRSLNSSGELALQPHPIHLLIEQGTRQWQRKLDKQSKTLRQAVDEYKRRYNRQPPKGFDAWYWMAKGNGFQLLDEFDTLDRTLQQFLAVPSSILHARSDKLQNDPSFWIQDKTVTIEIGKAGTRATARGPMKDTNPRAQQMLQLLNGIVKYLPDMNVTMTAHDVPWIVQSAETREELSRLGRWGNVMDLDDVEDVGDKPEYDGWAAACPPTSALRKATPFPERAGTYTPSSPSFIQDHQSAMSMCGSPKLQPLHGFTAWNGPRPGLLYPLFSFTTTDVHSDLLLPPVDQYDTPVGLDPSWEEKTDSRVVWRGTTTGADLNIEHMRKWSQRPRLCRLPHQNGSLTIPLSLLDTPTTLGPLSSHTTSASTLAAKYFDFKFVGEPMQCSAKVCKEFKDEFEWGERMSTEESNKYKFVMDVDGNGWSGRFHRLLSSNSVVLKSTIFPEWYQDRIQPWVHYVPVSTDFEDLWAIQAFFVGDEKGRGAHDEMAKEIAMAGKKWAANNWRWSDMEVYLYRLLLEYARIMNRDPHNPTNMDLV